MRILKLTMLAAAIIMSAGLVSCKSQGPLTPEEAFDALKKAYRNEDASAVTSLLSEESRQKISLLISQFAKMQAGQMKAIAERFGVTDEKLKNLSPQDYLKIQMALSKKVGEDSLERILNNKIISTDIENNKAVIKVENGMELRFVKEGLYWKFEME